MFCKKNTFSLRDNFTISKILKSYKSYQKPLIDMFNPSSYRAYNSTKISEIKLNQIESKLKNKKETNQINIKKEHNILENEIKENLDIKISHTNTLETKTHELKLENKKSSNHIPKHAKTYKHSFSTTEKNYINVHKTYTTDDTDEYNLINLINEDVSKGNKFGWELSIKSKEVEVYSKKSKLKNGDKSIITKTIAIFPYPINIVIQYLEDFEYRKRYEMMMKRGKSIEKIKYDDNLEKEYLYLYLKMPLMFDDRDFVEEKKLWINHGKKDKTALFLLKSVERDDYPIKKGIVRGEMIINGNYLEEISKNKTGIVMVCEMDIKMSSSIATSLMAKEAPKGQKEWVKDTLKRLPEYIKEKGIVIN